MRKILTLLLLICGSMSAFGGELWKTQHIKDEKAWNKELKEHGDDINYYEKTGKIAKENIYKYVADGKFIDRKDSLKLLEKSIMPSDTDQISQKLSDFTSLTDGERAIIEEIFKRYPVIRDYVYKYGKDELMKLTIARSLLAEEVFNEYRNDYIEKFNKRAKETGKDILLYNKDKDDYEKYKPINLVDLNKDVYDFSLDNGSYLVLIDKRDNIEIDGETRESNLKICNVNLVFDDEYMENHHKVTLKKICDMTKDSDNFFCDIKFYLGDQVGSSQFDEITAKGFEYVKKNNLDWSELTTSERLKRVFGVDKERHGGTMVHHKDYENKVEYLNDTPYDDAMMDHSTSFIYAEDLKIEHRRHSVDSQNN